MYLNKTEKEFESIKKFTLKVNINLNKISLLFKKIINNNNFKKKTKN